MPTRKQITGLFAAAALGVGLVAAGEAIIRHHQSNNAELIVVDGATNATDQCIDKQADKFVRANPQFEGTFLPDDTFKAMVTSCQQKYHSDPDIYSTGIAVSHLTLK